MKKILVPVDFSKLSDNALAYASALSDSIGTDLTLMHVFYMPIMMNDAASLLPSKQTLEKENTAKLEKARQHLKDKYPHLDIHIFCTEGIAADEISRYAVQQEVDLIVIGSQGVGYLEARLFGNTATALMRDSSTPVLAVNNEMSFNKPEKMLLAVDHHPTDNNTSLKLLKQLASSWNAQLTVLNVRKEQIEKSAEEQHEFHQLAHALKDVPHTFIQQQHPDVISGINKSVKENEVELVVMIARKHSLISRIFNEPLTKQMAFHSKVPLLVLHA